MCEQILSRGYKREGTGDELRVEMCLVDSGYKADVVYQFCRQSPFASVLKPSKGRGIRAADKPMSEWRKDKLDQVGQDWRIDAANPNRHVLVDANAWKSFVAARLATPVATPTGCLMLNGSDPREHELFASHLVSEYQVETSGRGRTLREWKWRPERNDNHWWDALVLSAVAASVKGLKWDTASAAGEQGTAAQSRPVVKMSDIQRQKREAKRAGRRKTG